MGEDEQLTTVTAPSRGGAARPEQPGGPDSPVPAEPQPGEELLGRFRIERRLGAGATGVVFEVTELATGKTLALKALRAPRPHRAHLLKSEFRAVRDLVHPQLVTVHELFVQDERALMTMDAVSGITLTEAGRAAAEEGRWPAVRDLFGQCAAGVDALHAHGYLHRDLKPSHVLVDPSDRVTILDFGLASDNPALRGAGTVAYMAPEQLAGDPLSLATDWYAVGVMLYCALSGGSPRDISRGRPEPDDGRALAALPEEVPADLAELCRSLLAFDPTDRPSSERIHEVLQASGAPSVTGRARFVGRHEELETLRRALADTRRHGPRCVILRGEPGTGKTRLVRELLRRAREQQAALVLRASCSEYEHVAFNAFDHAVDRLAVLLEEETLELDRGDAGHIARLFPALGPVLGVDVPPRGGASGQLPREERQAGFRAFGRLLAAVAATRPVILWIDDVQWTDGDSIQLLRSLVASRPAPPLLLLGCARASQRPSAFEAVVSSCSWPSEELELGHLPDDSALEMAARALHQPPSHPLARRVATESHGHPLLIEQLVALGESEPAGTTMERALQHRLDELPPQERNLLDLVSTHGQPLRRGLAHELAAGHGGTRTLKNLCVRRLCSSAAGTIDVYHDRIREAVQAQLTPEQRRARHRTLYETLAGREGSPPALLAEHAGAAELHEEAFGHLCDAAERAHRSLAFHQAAELLRAALGLPASVLSSPRREGLVRERLASALVAAGRGPEAAEQHLELARRADRGRDHAHRCRAAEQLLLSGRSTEGFAVLADVLDAVGVRVPRSKEAVLAALLASRAQLRLRPRAPARPPTEAQLQRVDALAAGAAGHIVTDTLRGAWFAARELYEAERTGDSPRIVHASVYEAMYLANEGTSNRRALDDRLARARWHARRAGDVESDALLSLAEGLSAVLLGRWAYGAAKLREGEHKLTHPACQRWFELNLCRKVRSIALWFTGTVAEMERSLSLWLEDAEERGDEAAVRSFSAERPLVALLGDRPGEAEAYEAELERSASPGVFDESRVVSLHNRMHHALYVGTSPAQLLALADAIQPLWRSLLGRGQLLRVTSRFYAGQVVVAAALARGGSPTLLRRVERAARHLEREGPPYPRLYAGLLRGAVEAQRGERAAARERLAGVCRRLAEDGQRLYAAGARWRLGELTDGASGGALIEDARRTLLDLGVVRPERAVHLLAPGFP